MLVGHPWCQLETRTWEVCYKWRVSQGWIRWAWSVYSSGPQVRISPRRCLRKVFDEVCDPLVARVIEGGSWCQWEGSNNTAESEQQRKSGT